MRSYGRGISYTVQFAPSVEFDSTSCNKDEPKSPQEKTKRRKKPRKGRNEDKLESEGAKDELDKKEDQKAKQPLTLADVHFVWAYTNGERVS